MASNDSIMSMLGRVHAAWRRRLQDRLLGRGITLPQLEALRALAECGTLNPSRLADMIDCDRATMSCILRNLEAESWITVSPNRDNAKYRDVRLTAKGRAKRARVDADLAAAGSGRVDPLACLGRDERSALRAALEKLMERLAG